MDQTNHQRLLDDEQKSVVFAFCREFYAKAPVRPGRVRACKQALKEHLTSIGWEDILIQLAIAIAAKLLTDWIRGKFQSAPTVMPIGFGSTPVEEVSDEDPDSD